MQLSELDEDSDELIRLMYAAARVYAKRGGFAARKDEKNDPQYELILFGLTLHFYDHRETLDPPESELPLGLRRSINQRKLTDGFI